MSEKQTNYTIMEGYELPSHGKIYDQEVNPHIELRSMTARDEMKRLSPSTTPLKTLSDIIEGCCIEKPAIHVYDMGLGDYEYLLHKLRIVTYGENYKLNCRCSECGEVTEATAKLGETELNEIDLDKYEELKAFTLPASGHNIVLKNQTPHLLETIEAKTKEMNRKYKNAGLDFETYAKLICSIDSVNGNKLNQLDLEHLISGLAAKDMQKILNNIDAISRAFGLDTNIYVTCAKCGAEIKTFFRYGPDFFRPTEI